MFIGHVCYGVGVDVGVGAVEVDEPEFWDYSCSLVLDGLQVALAEPAVDGIIFIGCSGDDLWYGECIGDSFEFLFEPSSEADGKRGRKSCFVLSGLRILPYYAVENSAWAVTYFSGCFAESSM